MHISFRSACFAVLALALLAAARTASAQLPALQVNQYQLVASKRVSATVFEYDYRVVVGNAGAAAQRVTGALSSASSGVRVVAGGVAFGNVAAAGTASSAGTIKLRHDRTQPFRTQDLRWHFSYNAAPTWLIGAPGAAATASAQDFFSGDAVAAGEMLDHPVHGRVARTKLGVLFTTTATTQDVNNLLAAVQGGITTMLSGSALFGLRVADVASAAGLDALVARARAQPGVLDVFPASALQTLLLPDNPGLGGDPMYTQLGVIEHQLAAKVHGAWNVQKVFNDRFWNKPPLLVVDHFGDGPPNLATWSFTVPHATDFTIGSPDVHGYFIGSVIGAAFGGPGTSTTALITGLLPGPGELWAIDLQRGGGSTLSSADFVAAVLKRLKDSVIDRAVVSVSIGYCDRAACSNPDNERTFGLVADAFAKALRAANLEDKVVLTVAAGNSGVIAARQTGPLQRALIGPLPDAGTPPLRNGLVVESFESGPPSDPASATGCRASNSGGTIGGFGQVVAGYTNRQGDWDVQSGSSIAAPQLAGAAHFLWTMGEPALKAPQVVDRLIATATPKTGCAGGDGRVLNVFAALLATDRQLQFGRAPVREALLDVASAANENTPDDKFDRHDLRRFIKAFAQARAAAPPGQFIADYSRFDLNGDGYTAGEDTARTARFKLAEPFFPAAYLRPDPLAHGVVTQALESVPVAFDENRLTDLEILAYYAYSPLYETTADDLLERTLLFLPFAGKLRLKLDSVTISWKAGFIAPPGWTVPPGGITLAGIGAPAATYFGSNGMAERGNPLFSQQIAAEAYQAVQTTEGIPFVTSQQAPNRLNASSFVAINRFGDVWINATGRLMRFTGTTVFEREYQSRFYLGDSTGNRRNTQSVTIGSVPGDGNFNATPTSTGDKFDVAFKFVAAP